MAVQSKQVCLDLVARNYTSNHAKFKVISGSHMSSAETAPVAWRAEKKFTLRCYFSLQGEDRPVLSSMRLSSEAPATGTGQMIYRYDWSFGITLIEGFYWDWMKELPDDGALAIHLVLKPLPFGNGPEAIPIAAILSTMHPSKNTKSIWEQMLPMLPETASGMAKIGASALPILNYVSSGLMLGSNVLASRADNKQNWFLYQFLDEKLKCPVVEWRISRKVLIEYGPLIRGTLFLAFQGPVNSESGAVQILLRPQIRYCKKDELAYIIPTKEMGDDKQVLIDVRPIERKAPSV